MIMIMFAATTKVGAIFSHHKLKLSRVNAPPDTVQYHSINPNN